MKLIPPLVVALLALSSGCAFEPGDPFARVTPSLDARYSVPEDRELEGDFVRLASDYEVKLTTARMTLGDGAFLAAGTSGPGLTPTGGTFDPAKPPPGISNCHGGHCHAEDGSLVSYEEVQAQLSGSSGGAAQERTALGLHIDRELDLLEGVTFPLECEPTCSLDRVTLHAFELGVEALVLEGVVRDSRTPARLPEPEMSFVLTLSEEALSSLRVPLSLEADHEHFPNIAIDVLLQPGPAMFDGVDWAANAAPATAMVDLNAPSSEAAAAREALIDSLMDHALNLDITRSP